MRPTTLTGLLPLLAGVLCAMPAGAAEEKSGVEAAAMAGYGVSNEPNIIGPGLGLRLGFADDARWYLGAIALVHFGSTDDGEADVHHYSQSYRAELGLPITLPLLELRPSVRAGFAHVTTPRDTHGRFWSPDLGVGASLLLRLDGPFLGVDAEVRYLTHVVENGDASISLTSIAGYGVAGIRF